jgi:3-hydroxyisobutyrate dehydrogenase-like beta-hydroxyacid dehydrogenase
MEHLPLVAVLGTGLMGTAIGRRLMEAGYSVLVWNRTRDRADTLLGEGAVWNDRLVEKADRILLALYDSAAVEEVVERFGEQWRPGTIVIDTTTGDPDRLPGIVERLSQFQVHYLEAPVSGSSEQTRRGEATILIGGDRQIAGRCEDLWRILAKTVFVLDHPGDAARMKLASNLVLGLNRAALAEGLALAGAMGIDPALALEVFRGSAAQSRVMETKGRKMVESDYQTQAKLEQHLKDLRIIQQTASHRHVEIPLTEVHCQMLQSLVDEGMGQWDNSAVREYYRRREKSPDA